QGPISTFIHTNPLHHLEHLTFDDAVAAAEQLLGGRGYLPNEDFRQLYQRGRITDHDIAEALTAWRSNETDDSVGVGEERVVHVQEVLRLHLLYGIDPIDPAHLSWQAHGEHATSRLRPDLPPDTKTALLTKASSELRLSLDRIGREWTLAEWLQVHCHLDLPGHLRKQLRHEYDTGTARDRTTPPTLAQANHWFDALEIPPERRDGYRRCINRHLYNTGLFSTALQQALQTRWLELEYEILREVVPRHLHVKGTFLGIRTGCEHDLERYAAVNLWHAALATRGLDDPLSPSDPETLVEQDCLAARRDTLYRRILTVEQDGGSPLPLTADVRTAIQEELRLVGRQRQRRRTILFDLCRPRRPGDSHDYLPPLTLSAEADLKLRTLRQGEISAPAGLLRLAGEIRVRKGFDWRTWKQICDRPLFINPSSAHQDGPWRMFLNAHVRVRVTDNARLALQEELSPPRSDPHAEARRTRILGGLTDEGLTLQGWQALQEDIAQWEDLSKLHQESDIDLEVRLCRTVQDGLRETELSRPAYDALQQLIEHRDRTLACHRLLADLHQFDPRERLVKHSRADLTATMERVGHSLTVSELLLDLTGLDIVEPVNRYMIKWCGAFLDQGIASWSMPYRELGFYRAWKILAVGELPLALGEVDGWREAVLALPERADDSLLQTLQSLHIPEQYHSPYLRRRLLKLPGWASLVKWREHHPRHFKQAEEHIDLVEYLAVRLFCESMLIRHACRDIWGLEGTLPKLSELHRDHPYEFYLRREYFRGKLPDYLLARCKALLQANPQQDRDRWIRLAEMIWTYRQATALGRDPLTTACHHAWRLFHLSQLLGLSAGDLRRLPLSDGDRLLAMLDRFPSSTHGPIWQSAFEGHYQRDLLRTLGRNRTELSQGESRPQAQLVFCIDEREESIRRHIESLSPAYETFGTAGFFGVVMNYSGLDGHGSTPLCPVVVTPNHAVQEVPAEEHLDLWKQSSSREHLLVKVDEYFVSLKKNIILSYFVIDLAAIYMAIILLGKTLVPRRFAKVIENLHQRFVKPVHTRLTIDASPEIATPDHPSQQLGFLFDEQIGLVEGQLRVMGLTKRFSRLVVFLGHGSTSQNNPHESAHDCGACGGKHGGPNARALAAMSNKPEVRAALRDRGIDIPDDTCFIGSQHNTASDNITFFDTERIPLSHREEFSHLVRDLREARALNARERCRLLPVAPKNPEPAQALRHVERRSVDFSQVHPEWGHATNASVIVGRRALSKGLDLDRRTFMQSYNPFDDPEGTILERIMTAVGPVCAGIGLEYYFSRVDNIRYGSGTKVPHNVSGLVGVMDGAHSDLRTGLPFQMVWVHEPLRLTFIVESRPSLVSSIVQRHKNLQHLFDNRWLHLIVLDIQTGQFVRYEPVGSWSTIPAQQPAVAR
ncbi:MAG: DUF2309 domain-containing protein, partial [Nitrospira sp.]|nr:DUF2309 domain-containing protein [Nitrospira sp.]